MDSTRETPAKHPARSFAPLPSFTPSDLPAAVAQPQTPSTLPSKQTLQTLAAPIQPASAGVAHSAMSQAQPLAQALNTSAPAGLSVVQPVTAASAPQTENTNTTLAQQPADVYPHQVTGLGGPTATAPFLQDFSLVAEAAKRAQMAVVMRDLESVTL